MTRGPAVTDDLVVTVYHACPTFATGGAIGPGSWFAAWWAEPDPDGWRIRLVSGDPRHDGERWAAILMALPLSPAERRRRTQDEQAEAPDEAPGSGVSGTLRGGAPADLGSPGAPDPRSIA